MLAACAQAVEHYEIARYGTLKTWASQLGYADAAKLLDETLQEEKKTDALLSKIAETVNGLGAEAGGVDEPVANAKLGTKAKAPSKAA